MTQLIGYQVAELASQAASAYQSEQQRLSEADRQLAAELEQLAARELQAWEQLTVTLIPGLVAEHLDWAANLLRLPAIASAQVQARIAAERRALEDELAAIEANPDYIDRELRINECAIHIAELDPVIEPLAASLGSLKAEPFFLSLVEIGYETPRYRHKWYELAFYRHWKYGDLVVERWGEPRGLTTFTAVRERWEQESKAFATLDGERRKWLTEKQRIEQLASRHTQLREWLTNIEERHWAQTRARVHDHLSELADRDLMQLFADYEPALYAAKRVAGIAAKRRYLEALRREWVAAPLAHVQTKLSKAMRSVDKYLRPKHRHSWFDGAEMQRKFRVSEDSWDKRWRNLDTARGRIVEFDRYDDFSLGRDVVWWHLMTEGEVKARFIPEVAHYYQHRSTRARGDDARDLAIAALAHEAGSASSESAFDDWS